MKVKFLCLLLFVFINTFSMATEVDSTENQVAEILQLTSDKHVDVLNKAQTNTFTISFANTNEQTGVSTQCCKVCRKGKACGDSCISKSKTCNVGSGCACDG